jgi:hypothetical protein
MDRNTKGIFAATFALAFLTMGAMIFLDWLYPIGTKFPNRISAPVEAVTESTDEPLPRSPEVARQHSIKTPDIPPQSPSTIENTPNPPTQAEPVSLRVERRRLAKTLLEEFRKPANAAPDWETTTHPALFLPNGKPIDPYMLPPLQLPAAMTIENPAIEITTDLQVSEWERLQDEFIAEVGGTLPNDPASRKTWIQAQRRNDEKFRLKFGTEAFLRQQMDAYRGGFLQK